MEHFIDVGRGELATCGGAHDIELFADVSERLAMTCRRKRPAHPLGYGHVLGTRQALDLLVLGIFEDHLKPLSHEMMLFDSCM